MFFAISYRLMSLRLSPAPMAFHAVPPASSPTIPHFRLDLLTVLYCDVISATHKSYDLGKITVYLSEIPFYHLQNGRY